MAEYGPAEFVGRTFAEPMELGLETTREGWSLRYEEERSIIYPGFGYSRQRAISGWLVGLKCSSRDLI